MDSFSTYDALDLADCLKKKEISQEELIAASLKEAAKWQPRVHGIAHESNFPVRSANVSDGVFAGVPTYIKDLEDVEGMPTRYGSKASSIKTATSNPKSVQQFLDCGFVCLGKSTTAEFGLIATTEPVFGKPTRNPHDINHSSGGSSGGAAALVASGVVPMAHGSDGGGSIRIPAAFCGLVGLKPSRGRLAAMHSEKFQAVPLTTYGVISRSLRDTISYYQDIEKREGTPNGLAPIGDNIKAKMPPQRIGLYLDGPSHSIVNQEIKDVVTHTAKILEGHGHHVELIPYPFGNDIEKWFVNYWSLMAQTISLLVLAGREKHQKLKHTEPWTRSLASHFRKNFYKSPFAIRGLRAFKHDYSKLFSKFDLLLCPTTADVAPPIGPVSYTHLTLPTICSV